METNTQSYAKARQLVEDGFADAAAGLRSEKRKRWIGVAVVAVIWAACSAALIVLGSNDMVAVSEVGWVLVVIFAVFRLLTMATARANLENLFGQYRAQLDVLERHGVDFPDVSSMEELVVAIDAASPEGMPEPASDEQG